MVKAQKSLPTAVVIIPTYNEAEVIGEMIDHLFTKTFPQVTNYQMHLLVVDDTSPDGTYKIVAKKQKQYPNLHLYLNKEKKGIGWAYVVGFKYAMKELGADVVIEFDADFQHPPKDIPILLSKIDDGYDYVLGSRKIKGGSNPKGWGAKRLFFSEFGGLVARLVLFFPGKNFSLITDPTTGLKASRVAGFADQLDMDHLYSYKFGYKLEFLYQMVVGLKAKTIEIPLQFGLRDKGESKIASDTAKDIFRSVFLSRWHDPATQKFLKFAVVGTIGFVVNTFFLEFFKRRGMSADNAAALGAELAIVSNFIWNNVWTFKSEQIKKVGQVISKFLQFNLSSIGAVLVQKGGIWLGMRLFGEDLYFLYYVLAVLIAMGLNWFMYNKVIWRKKK